MKEYLNEFDIELVLLNMIDDGYYLPKEKIIFVNSNLSDADKRQVIFHEIGHALLHEDIADLYSIGEINKMKMEYEADRFMLAELIMQNDGQYNYSELVEEFNLGLGWEDTLRLID